MASQHSKPARSKAAKGKPITANPLFPAVVALWFGALFGLGSLAIRVGLLESLVLASRIDTIIPAAGPPLGVSARILLALGLAAVGAALGAALARRIARPKPEVRERKRTALAGQEQTLSVRARDAHPDAPTRRPISAAEELGDGVPAGQATPPSGRRRTALTIEHEETFDLHEYAPLPGGVPQIHAAVDTDEALDLGDFADSALTADAFAPPPPTEGPQLEWPVDSANLSAEDAKQMFKPAASPIAGDALNFSPPADAVSGRQVFGMNCPQPDEVLDELGITDAEFEDFHPVAIPSSEPHHTADDQQPPASAEPAAKAAVAQDGDAKPGMIDLAEQLGQALQRRRERAAQAAAHAAEAAASPSAAPMIEHGEEPVGVPASVARTDADEIGNAFATPAAAADPTDPLAGFTHPNDLPAPFAMPQIYAAQTPDQAVDKSVDYSTPQASEAHLTEVAVADEQPKFAAIPAAMRPISFDSDDEADDDLPLASLLPPRSINFAAPLAGQDASPEEDSEEDASPADGFSSLLELGRAAPLRQNFIRIEEEPASEAIEPVVIFPGHATLASAAPATPEGAADERLPNGEFRRFDAPDSAEAGQPVASQPLASHQAAETEQALRAALANLQRMSGAA